MPQSHKASKSQCHQAVKPQSHRASKPQLPDHKVTTSPCIKSTQPQSFKVTMSPSRQATKPQSHRASKPQLPDHKVTTSPCHKSTKLIALMQYNHTLPFDHLFLCLFYACYSIDCIIYSMQYCLFFWHAVFFFLMSQAPSQEHSFLCFQRVFRHHAENIVSAAYPHTDSNRNTRLGHDPSRRSQ